MTRSSSAVASGLDVRRVVGLVVAVVAFAASIGFLFAQVEVTDDVAGATRSCGSVFDSLADRSGWELWWARDLDEPDDLVRSSLVRTRRCPAAVNRTMAATAVLGGTGALAAVLLGKARWVRPGSPTSATAGGRIARLGRTTSLAGGVLSLTGLIAVVILLADRDSTLFLYTDRWVVGVVGVVVLVPTLALLVIGRVVSHVGAHIDRLDRERDHG